MQSPTISQTNNLTDPTINQSKAKEQAQVAENTVGTHSVVQPSVDETQSNKEAIETQQANLKETEATEPHTPKTSLEERNAENLTGKAEHPTIPNAAPQDKAEVLKNYNEYSELVKTAKEDARTSGKPLSEDDVQRLRTLGGKGGESPRDINDNIADISKSAAIAKKYKEEAPTRAFREYSELRNTITENLSKGILPTPAQKRRLGDLAPEAGKGGFITDALHKENLEHITGIEQQWKNLTVDDKLKIHDAQKKHMEDVNKANEAAKPKEAARDAESKKLPAEINNPFFKETAGSKAAAALKAYTEIRNKIGHPEQKINLTQADLDSLKELGKKANKDPRDINKDLKEGEKVLNERKTLQDRQPVNNKPKTGFQKFIGSLKTLSRSAYNKLPGSVRDGVHTLKALGTIGIMASKGEITKEQGKQLSKDLIRFKAQMAKEGLKELSKDKLAALSNLISSRL
jgi:hypothetical protein